MAITIKPNHDFPKFLIENLKNHYDEKKRINNEVHVSDILLENCLRKQYYKRKFPDLNTVDNNSLIHFIRGESSEYVITKLANIGISQRDLEFDGLIAHPDIMNNEFIIELKDTMSQKRLDINNEKFISYIRQLLYYLIISGYEKGILSIIYNSEEIKFLKSDEKGDYFFRPKNTKKPEIVSWTIFLSKDDVLREILKNEMIRRKNLFLMALLNNNISSLPRFPEIQRESKCSKCSFYDRCMNVDGENIIAQDISKELDILSITGIFDFKNR